MPNRKSGQYALITDHFHIETILTPTFLSIILTSWPLLVNNNKIKWHFPHFDVYTVQHHPNKP